MVFYIHIHRRLDVFACPLNVQTTWYFISHETIPDTKKSTRLLWRGFSLYYDYKSVTWYTRSQLVKQY